MHSCAPKPLRNALSFSLPLREYLPRSSQDASCSPADSENAICPPLPVAGDCGRVGRPSAVFCHSPTRAGMAHTSR